MLVDILGIFNNGILIRDESCVVDASEIVRVDAILKKYISFLGNSVVTREGFCIGIVEDLIFDLDMAQIISIVAKKRFSSEKRIINADRIISVSSKKIIVRDILERSLANKTKREPVPTSFAN
jgi:sporulation protein YlmC with PRC-barrel domain